MNDLLDMLFASAIWAWLIVAVLVIANVLIGLLFYRTLIWALGIGG